MKRKPRRQRWQIIRMKLAQAVYGRYAYNTSGLTYAVQGEFEIWALERCFI